MAELPHPGSEATTQQKWTFLTNHAHVIVFLEQRPEATQREIASAVGMTERAVQHILDDLEDVGIVSRERVGRRNRYELHRDQKLRHPLESHRTVRDLLEMIG